jgi:hypothetical protein
MSFTITTTDSAYTYTADNATGQEVIERWAIQNNNKTSDTQGFLRKTEKGDTRVAVVMSLTDAKTTLETNVLPMLTYPTNVSCTFNRNIPGKTTNSGTFTFEDYSIVQEFDDGSDMEIEIKLTEVIS